VYNDNAIMLDALAAHHASTGRLMTAALIARMRLRCDDHLVHYAGAAHRDLVAWHMCLAYLATPNASEWELKSRALKAAYDWDLSPADILNANPQMATRPEAFGDA
jgi:hypothetical protein